MAVYYGLHHQSQGWLYFRNLRTRSNPITNMKMLIYRLNVFFISALYLSDRSFMVDPLSYFSFQPVLHDCSNKGRGMRYPVCEMMHIKEPLLLIGKSSPCGGSGFPLSLSEWSFTMCLTPYNRK